MKGYEEEVTSTEREAGECHRKVTKRTIASRSSNASWPPSRGARHLPSLGRSDRISRRSEHDLQTITIPDADIMANQQDRNLLAVIGDEVRSPSRDSYVC